MKNIRGKSANANEMSKFAFLFWHLPILFFLYLFYISIFRCYAYKSYHESKGLLISFILISIVFGCFYQWRSIRNFDSQIANSVLPFGVYTILTYYKIKSWVLMVCICGILAGFIIAFMIIIGFFKVKTRSFFKRVLGNRYIWALLAFRNIIVVTLVFVMTIILANKLFQYVFIVPVEGVASRYNIEEYTLEKHIGDLSLMREEFWSKLSLEKRQNILQLLLNIQQKELGIPHSMTISITGLGERTAGAYSDDRRCVFISRDSLQQYTGEQICNVVVHESYHAYEYALCEVWSQTKDEYKNLGMLKYAEEYQKELSNYVASEKNYKAYYNQIVEAHSREYAERRTNQIFAAIDDFLGVNDSDEP